MRNLIIVVVLLLVAVLAWQFWPTPKSPPPVADDSTLRTTQQGQVVGFKTASGALAWFGLPFAEPPIGDLRWRAPRPPISWSGRRDALQVGNMCVQFPSLLSGGTAARGSAPVG